MKSELIGVCAHCNVTDFLVTIDGVRICEWCAYEKKSEHDEHELPKPEDDEGES